MKLISSQFLNVQTRSCHASSVAFYKDKAIFAWFGGTMEGEADVAIYIQCGDKMHVIGDRDYMPRWNPVLFIKDDKLMLFLKKGVKCSDWQTVIYDISGIVEEDFQIDRDAKFMYLPAGLNGTVKTLPLVNDGNIYCPSSVETFFDWTSYIEIYDSKWKLLERSMPLVADKVKCDNRYGYASLSLGLIQPSLWYKNRRMHAFFRSSRGLGKIYYSYAKENKGLYNKWVKPIATSLENPNSSIDVVCSNDRLFLVHNPSATYRNPLVVSELKDDNEFEVIDQVVIREKIDGVDKTLSPELSYPFMIWNDGKLHCTYTYGRSKIEYVTIEV